MKLKVFTLRPDPATGAFDDEELVSFVAEHDAIAVDEHFFVHDGAPRWALLVHYRDEVHSRRSFAPGEPARDWREELASDETPVYEALRAWRNNRARREGRPAFVLFSNRQLADIARSRPATLAALREVAGVGDARVRDYGDQVLAVVQRAGDPDSGDGGPTTCTAADAAVADAREVSAADAEQPAP